jgi:hypothetical protein
VGVWEISESKNYIPFGDVVKNVGLVTISAENDDFTILLYV